MLLCTFEDKYATHFFFHLLCSKAKWVYILGFHWPKKSRTHSVAFFSRLSHTRLKETIPFYIDQSSCLHRPLQLYFLFLFYRRNYSDCVLDSDYFQNASDRHSTLCLNASRWHRQRTEAAAAGCSANMLLTLRLLCSHSVSHLNIEYVCWLTRCFMCRDVWKCNIKM